jgi:hypothetical protein
LTTQTSTAELECVSPEAAATVVAEATRGHDKAHTARRRSRRVIITYTDKRYPRIVIHWAAENGHATDDAAAAVIASL